MIDSSPRPFFIERPFRIKTYDIDFVGIVHNMVYVRWLEDLRLYLLDEHFPLNDQIAKGHSPILLQTNITYKGALRMIDEPVGQMWLSKLSGVRWYMQGQFLLGDEVIVTAEHVGCFVEMATMRPLRTPPELLASWQAAGGKYTSGH